MKPRLDRTDPLDRAELSAAEVAEYLAEHPGFLNDHSELLEVLIPPAERNGRRVLDMQRFLIERLQRRVADLRDDHAELIAASRSNRFGLSRVHAAVLALYEPGAFDDLVELVTTDLPALLEVDVVTLCVESASDRAGPLPSAPGVCVLAPGTVDVMLGPGREVELFAGAGSDGAIFGGAATLVKSSALLRLPVGRPGRPALLALGSRNPDRFRNGQGTELLGFLAQALGRRMREWLDRSI